MKGEMPDFAPKFTSHDTNGRNDTYKRKCFLKQLQILFYILQTRATETARNKCNFNKQFQAQLKTRFPQIFRIYILVYNSS